MSFDIRGVRRKDIDYVLKTFTLSSRISHAPIIVTSGYDVKRKRHGEARRVRGRNEPFLTRLSVPTMYTLEDALGYSHRLISPLEPALLTTPFDHSWLAGKHSTNRVLAQAPQLGYLDHGVVSLKRRILQSVFRSRSV